MVCLWQVLSTRAATGMACRKGFTGLLDIIIADDHPVVLMGLRALLEGQGGNFRVAGEAHGGKELLALLSERRCDLLITDFSMPDEQGADDGLLLLNRVRRGYPQLPIVVLTMLRNPALIRGMLTAGVPAVVDKASMTRELLLAMHAVSSGRSYLSGSLREGMTDTAPVLPQRGTTPAVALSAREAEIVRLYASGLTVTQIAEQVHRSVKTVSQQKNDAMRKLGLESNSQLYEYARRHGLTA